MKIIHHMGLRLDGESLRLKFRKVGLELPKGVDLPTGGTITSFNIAENDPRWHEVALLAQQSGATDFVSTEFSRSELQAAKFLGILATSHHGYPEPSDDNGYLTATFDLSGYCPACGIGKHQVQPFRVKRLPSQKSTSVLQLNWIFDEYFVSPELWNAVFKPFGITAGPVLLDRSGEELESLVQLQTLESVSVDVADLAGRKCKYCGKMKYRLVLKGCYPCPSDTRASIFKSKQFFGSGASAFRLVFVSDLLYARMKEAGVRGVAYYPARQDC